jgi:dihydrofolate reductase
MITLIVARGRNGAIGRNGEIPWHAPEDLAFFQSETRGGAVIMGRKTWESLPDAVRPLKGRRNIVVSRGSDLGEHTVATPRDGVSYAQGKGYSRIYGIGGASIYQALMPIANRLLITEVDLDVSDADTFFPTFDTWEWREIGQYNLRAEGPRCVAHEYLRRM